MWAYSWPQEGMLGSVGWLRHPKRNTRKVAQAGRPTRGPAGQPLRRYLSQVVSAQARAWPGRGLGGDSGSLGAGIAGGLPELLLELKPRLPVGLKQLLEAGVEVVVLLLQVVQTGVDLVQHGVDGSVFSGLPAVIICVLVCLPYQTVELHERWDGLASTAVSLVPSLVHNNHLLNE